MDYAAKAKLDHLIVCTGTIAYICDDVRKKEVLDHLSGTPLLNVASIIDGYDFRVVQCLFASNVTRTNLYSEYEIILADEWSIPLTQNGSKYFFTKGAAFSDL